LLSSALSKVTSPERTAARRTAEEREEVGIERVFSFFSSLSLSLSRGLA
jgi:hypothetical protein